MPTSIPARALGFSALVIALVAALVFIWQWLPSKTAAPRPTSMPVVSSTQPQVSAIFPSEPTSTSPAPEFPPAVNATSVRLRPTSAICDTQNFICVAASYQNALLSNPLTVTGTAIAFENQFAWRLEDAVGQDLASGNVMSQAPDAGQPGLFQIRSFLSRVPQTTTGKLVLFEPSAKDGTPTHILSIQIGLSSQSTILKLRVPGDLDAWQKAAVDLQGGSGDHRGSVAFQTVSVEVAATRLPMEATVRALVDWLNAHELSPVRLELVDFRFQDGVAHVSLNIHVDGWAGVSFTASKVDPIIEKTLRQFSQVQNVVIGDAPRP